MVPVSADIPFPEAWNQTVISCRRGATARS
jgi:hypothetical protein